MNARLRSPASVIVPPHAAAIKPPVHTVVKITSQWKQSAMPAGYTRVCSQFFSHDGETFSHFT